MIGRLLRGHLPGSTSPAWAALETAFATLGSLLGALIIAGIIGPQEAGTANVALAAYLMIEIVIGAVFTDALVQRPQLEDRHAASAFWLSLILAAVAMVGLVLLAPSFAGWMGAPGIAPLLLWLAPMLPLATIGGVISGLALRRRDYRLLALRAIIGQPVAMLAGIGIALGGGGAMAVVAVQITTTLVTVLLLAGFGRFRPRLTLEWAAIRDLAHIAVPQLGSVVVFVARTRLFLLVFALGADTAQVALFNLGVRLSESLVSLVSATINRIALPMMAQDLREDRPVAPGFAAIARAQALAGAPVAAGTALVASDLVLALLGPSWTGADGVLAALSWSALVVLGCGPMWSYWIAIGRPRLNLYSVVAAAGLALAAVLVLRPQTAMGAALCSIAGNLPPTVLLLHATLRRLHRDWRWFGRTVGPALPGLAAMAAAVMGVQALAAAWGPGPRLIVSVAAGAASYLTVAWWALGRPRRLADVLAPRPVATPATPPPPTPPPPG